MRKDAGFTLMELMIVIAIAGILLGIGVPNFLTYVSSYRLKGALSTLQGDLYRAKMLAIKRGVNCQVVINSGGYDIERWDSVSSQYVNELTRDFADEYEGVTASTDATPVFSPRGTVTPTLTTITLTNGPRSNTISIFVAGKIRVN